jgi:16S rRNA (adenine1518-N6/adenine1519-N6)-dimethyltransferase
VEIGPGRGALTAHLLERADRVVAVEIDPILVQYLRAKFRGADRLELVEGDILRVDLARWGPAVVVGNLPYYITSPIVEKVLGLGAALTRAVFLVQKEVAERLTAAPGSRDYGYLTVATQFFAQVEYLFTVPPAAFQPAPKVDSAVVRLTPRRELPGADPAEFLRFASLCFQHKRKTLRNNLSEAYGRDALAPLPEAGLRAEQMSLEALLELYEKLHAPITTRKTH